MSTAGLAKPRGGALCARSAGALRHARRAAIKRARSPPPVVPRTRWASSPSQFTVRRCISSGGRSAA